MRRDRGAWTIETTAAYRKVRTIASGGMGRVDLAVRREGTFQRLYAIKRLHPHLRDDDDVRAMFLDEARIAGLIRHPNVVSVVDLGQDEDGPFLVMDYVDGVPLTDVVARAARSETLVPLDVALRIVAQAALGLAAAHELTSPEGEPLGLVHRDVSPHNILVGFDGVARVTDFGIAKALGRQARTSTGILKGKLGYMSPEQLRFRAPDRRSDIFSLGVVLYEVLAARRLYAAKEPEEAARRILEEPPPDLADVRDDAPPELVGLLFEMLAKEPEHRPSDARTVAHVLEGVLAELTATGQRTDTSEYLAEAFAEERSAQGAEASAALAAEAPWPPSGEPPARQRWRTGSIVVIAVATIAALALAVSLPALSPPSAPTDPPTSTTRASAPSIEPPSTAAAPERDAGPETITTETITAETAPEAAPEAASDDAAARDLPPPSRARSRARATSSARRRQGRGGGELGLWGWQE